MARSHRTGLGPAFGRLRTAVLEVLSARDRGPASVRDTVLLQRLTLLDFRNFAACDVELSPHFTVLWGHNGAGKTNLLESIYLVSTLRSFRSADLGVLVRHDRSAASVELQGFDRELEVKSTLAVRLARPGASTRRTAVADGKTIRSAADFYGRVRAVLFTPEDLGVLRGSPTGRRQFIDRMLFARDRGHIGDVQRYEKLVRSRNHVLKRDEGSRSEREDLLATYEAGLADVGARVWTRRADLVDELARPFEDAFTRIHGVAGPTPGEASGQPLQASVRYLPKLGDVPPAERREALLAGLLERRREDERRGSTTVGPHRDELEVTLGGRGAGEFASQGQARALVLAFKLAELQTIRAIIGHPPLLLLDDVSSELDPRRSALLFDALAEQAGQCLLTTTAPHYVELPKTSDAVHWHVDRGTLRRTD